MKSLQMRTSRDTLLLAEERTITDAGVVDDEEVAANEITQSGGVSPSWENFFQQVDSEDASERPSVPPAVIESAVEQSSKDVEESYECTQTSISTPSTPSTPNAPRMPGFGVATLPCKKAPCYGLCPTEETECLKLTRCEQCGIVTTLIGITHHMRLRHGRRASTSSDGSHSEEDEYQDFLLSPPHQPLVASTSSSDSHLREQTTDGEGLSAYTGRIRSPPYYVETHRELRMVLLKRPITEVDKVAVTRPGRRVGATTNKKGEIRAKRAPAVRVVGRGRGRGRGGALSNTFEQPDPSCELGEDLASGVNEAEELGTLQLHKKKTETRRRQARKAPVSATHDVAEPGGSAKRLKASTLNAGGEPDERIAEEGNHHDSSPEMRVLARLLSTPGLSITAMTSGGKSSPIKDLLDVASPPPSLGVGSKKRSARGRLTASDMAAADELRRKFAEKRMHPASPLPLKFAPHLLRALPASPHSSDSSLSSAEGANQQSAGSSAGMRLRHPRAPAARTPSNRVGSKALGRVAAMKREENRGQQSDSDRFPAPTDVNIPDFVRQQAHLENALSSIKTSSSGFQQPQHHTSTRSPPPRRSVAGPHAALNPPIPATTSIPAGTPTMIGGTRFVAVPLVNPPALPVFTPSAVPRRAQAHQAAASRTHRRGQPPLNSGGAVDQEPRVNASSPAMMKNAGEGGVGLKSCLRKVPAGPSNERFLLSHPNHITGGAPQPFILNGSISVDQNGIHRLSSFSSSESCSTSVGVGVPHLTMQRNEKKRRDDMPNVRIDGDIVFPQLQQQPNAPPPTSALRHFGVEEAKGGREPGNRSGSAARSASAAQQNHPLLRKYRPIIPRQQAAAGTSSAQHHINLPSPQLTMMLVRQESQQLHINTTSPQGGSDQKRQRSAKRLTAAASLITVGPGDPIPIPLSNRNSPAGSEASEGRRSVTSHGSSAQPASALSLMPMSISHSLGVINQAASTVELYSHHHHHSQQQQQLSLCSPPPPLQLYASNQAACASLPMAIPSTLAWTSTSPTRHMAEPKSFAFFGGASYTPLPPPLAAGSSRPTPTYSKLPPILQRHHRASHLSANRQQQQQQQHLHQQMALQKQRGTAIDNLPPKLHANMPMRSSDRQTMTPSTTTSAVVVGESWRDLGSALSRGGGQMGGSPPLFESSGTAHPLAYHRGGMMASPPTNFPGTSSAIGEWHNMQHQHQQQQQQPDYLMDAPPVLEAQVPIQPMMLQSFQQPPSYQTPPLQPPAAPPLHFPHVHYASEDKLARPPLPPPQLLASHQHRNMPSQHLPIPLGKTNAYVGSQQTSYGLLDDINDAGRQ